MNIELNELTKNTPIYTQWVDCVGAHCKWKSFICVREYLGNNQNSTPIRYNRIVT